MEKLILGDCLEEMKSIPDSSIDMIMADLPYGTTSCRWDTIIPFEPLWEQYKRVIKKNGAIVLTASQPFTSALVMSNIEMFKYCWVWEKSMPSGMATSSFMPMKYHEDICVFVKEGKPTFNKQLSERSDAGKVRAKSPIQGNTGKLNHVLMNRCEPKLYSQETVNPKSIIKIGSVANSTGRLHPTQKPVALMEYLIKTYTNEGAG
jgi:site-specific DNA-methyltransferase (adenine-specific)